MFFFKCFADNSVYTRLLFFSCSPSTPPPRCQKSDLHTVWLFFTPATALVGPLPAFLWNATLFATTALVPPVYQLATVVLLANDTQPVNVVRPGDAVMLHCSDIYLARTPKLG